MYRVSNRKKLDKIVNQIVNGNHSIKLQDLDMHEDSSTVGKNPRGLGYNIDDLS